MPSLTEYPDGGNPAVGLSTAMQAIHGQLVELIRAAQEASPFEHQGEIWAKPLSQEAWCRAGGFALRTFQELIKFAPIRRLRCMVDGRITTLLRVGEPGAEQAKTIAKGMQAYWCAATKEAKVSGDEFGMLCGLARDWPDGWQVEIFKHALIRWPDFVDDVGVEVELAIDLRDTRQSPFHRELLADPLYATARRLWPERDKLSRRVYRRPFIPFLRRFWPVAWELFVDHRQRYGGGHPERVWQRWSVPRQRTGVRHAESSS